MRPTIYTSLLAALPMTVMAHNSGITLSNTSAIPRHFGILLTPSITPIDLFGPLDVWQSVAMSFQNQTGKMHLSVLSVNTTSSTTNAPMPGLDFGMDLVPTVTLDEYLRAMGSNFSNSSNYVASSKLPGPLDVLLVPGGGGTRKDVSHEIDFVKAVYPSLKHIISVCTGSTILARAGVLDNKRATTNKKAWAWATSFGTNVNYIPQARWVEDGNVWTSSGVSAGVDATYAWVASVYGEEAAQWVADNSEYTRWTNASYDPFAERWHAGKPEPADVPLASASVPAAPVASVSVPFYGAAPAVSMSVPAYGTEPAASVPAAPVSFVSVPAYDAAPAVSVSVPAYGAAPAATTLATMPAMDHAMDHGMYHAHY